MDTLSAESGPILPTHFRVQAPKPSRRTVSAHLEYLELTDFKSYSGHHALGPLKKGLNCIVGSNGSGKSNLMDAICFVLGVETKFLRGLRLHDLGYRREGKGGAVRSAEVTMRLRVPAEPVEGPLKAHPALEVGVSKLASFGRRAVDGKTSQFLIEGKVVDRAAYLKALSHYNILPKVQNCIVSQGQVEAWSLNTDKEKATMFDEVSGSAQYKDKYEALQKEIQHIALTQSRVNQEATTLHREFKALKTQWEELKAWQVAEDQMKKANSDLFSFRLYVNETASNRLRGLKEQIEKDIARLEEKTKSLDALQRQKEEQRRELAAQVNKLEQEKDKVEKEAKNQGQKVESLQEKVASIEEDIQKEEDTKKAKLGEIDELYAQYNSLGEQWSELFDQRTTLSKKHDADTKKNAFTKLAMREKQAYLKEKEKVSLKTAELQGKLQHVVSLSEHEERDLRALQSQATQAKAEADLAQVNLDQCKQAEAELRTSLAEFEQTRATLQSAFEQLDKQKGDLKESKTQLTAELMKHNQTVISFSQFRSEDSKAARFRQTLDRLRNEIPGVFDRVTGLCELNNQRFATAVSTALGLQADSVVVDCFSTAKQAIELCKRMQVPPVEFLPLDTIKSRPLDLKWRNHSDLFTPIIDVLQFDTKFQRIFDHILEDTVVVDDLDRARNVAFVEGKRLGLPPLKIVTIDGQTILKNFNIKLQGPRSGQMDRFAQKQRDTALQMCTELKEKLSPIEEEYRRIERLHLQTDTDYAKCRIEHDQTSSSLKTKLNQLSLLQRIAEEKSGENSRLNAQVGEKQVLVDDLYRQSKSMQEQIEKIQQQFLKTDDLIAIQKAEAELILLKSAYEKELIKMKDRENHLQLELNQILRRLGGSDKEGVSSGSGYEVETVMSLIEDAFNNPQSIVREHQHTIEKLREDLAKVEREEATEMANLSYVNENLQRVQRALQDKLDNQNNIALGLHDLNVDRKRTFHKLSGLAMEFQSSEQELEVLDTAGEELIQEIILKDIRVPVKNGTFEEFCEQFENPDTFMGDADTPIEFDFSELSDDLRSVRTSDEILEAQAMLEKRFTALKDELMSKGHQNHKAEEAYEGVKEKLRVVNQSKEKLRSEHDKKAEELQKTSDVRKEKFMACFNHTREALKQIYATLTEPPKSDFSGEGAAASIFAKHFSESVGGSANLELEDVTAEEPFNNGVIFTAMPYGKRYTEMELLSGGEKSMATLALLFSLQSYRQSPFVILDEVDAALDAANVDALRRFLQRAKFQVVIVTLKEEMYCHADAIIGVYKDQVVESSETVTLDVEAYPLAPQTSKPSPPHMTLVT